MKQIWEENFNDLYRNFEDMQNHCKYLESENNQLQSNWNSLRQWVQKHYDEYKDMEQDAMFEFGLMLDKMNELEGKNRE